MFDSYKSGQLTREEYECNCMFLLAAGYETTASAVSIICYYLARYPEVQEKLRRDILQCGGLEDKCEYFDFVFQATLHLYPSVPGYAGRIIREELVTQDGLRTQPGWAVVPSIYAVHRCKKFWGADADQFSPERFIDTSKHLPGQYVPFGLGPRNCVGGNLAKLEVKAFLSAILMRYRIEPAPGRTFASDDLNFKSPNLFHLILEDRISIKLTKLKSD